MKQFSFLLQYYVIGLVKINLRSLGLSSKCKSKPRLRDVNSVTPIKTSSSSSISSDKKRNSVKSVSKHNSILNGGSTSKLRLTYGAGNDLKVANILNIK